MQGAFTVSSGLKGHALYLDVDGTILDIAPSPDTVEVPDDMVPLLRALSGTLEGAVAFVSGRPIRGPASRPKRTRKTGMLTGKTPSGTFFR